MKSSSARDNRAGIPVAASRWAYRAESTRDLRLDWIRGAAVGVMIVDHLGGASWLRLITGGNAFLVSAAEFFVFISGWVGGIVWSRIVQSRGLGTAVWRILRRAAILYALTVILTVGFGIWSIYFRLPWATDIANIDWRVWVQNTALLKQTLPFADVLLLYTLLFATAPLALFLLYRGRTLWLLIISAAVWLSYQITGYEIPWQIPGYGFQFAAWQLLFFIAMVIGFNQRALARRLERIPIGVCLIIAAILFAALVAYYQSALSAGAAGDAIASSPLFLKSGLAVGRLGAFAIALAFAYLGIHLLWKPMNFLTGWLLLPLGQNALAAYTLHILAVALAAAFIPAEWYASPEISTAVQAAGVLAIWYLVQVRFSSAESREQTETPWTSTRILDEGEESS